MMALPVAGYADAHTVKCANGSYNIETVDQDYFGEGPDAEKEYDDYCQELAEIVCREHGDVPR